MAAALRFTVPAGLIDAGAASLATFAAGFTAARLLDAAALGVYALFFSGFMLAFAVPNHLIFYPAAVATLDRPPARRLSAVPRTAVVGAAMSLVSAVAAVALCALLAPDIGRPVMAPLALTAGAAAFVWPVQDYLRQMLHMSRRSWVAAGMSGLNMAVVLVALAGGAAAGIDPIWLPFGAIALGNVASLPIVLVAWDRRRHGDGVPQALGPVLRSGRFYLAFGGAPIAAAFVVSVMVGWLAGAAALGHAEAARIVAQPIAVLAVGLNATMGPRSLEAGEAHDRPAARRLARIYIAIVTATGALAAAAVGWAWPANVVARLLPDAYAVPGLVAVSIAANVLWMSANPFRNELLGAGREPTVTRIDLVSALAQCVVAGSAAVTGALARPLALAAQGAAQVPWLRHAADRMLAEPPDDGGDARRPKAGPILTAGE